MPADAWNRGSTRLHQRGTTALVLSRNDAHRPGAHTSGLDPEPAPPALWRAVLTWTLLGGAIAALWALLLLGDSLVTTG